MGASLYQASARCSTPEAAITQAVSSWWGLPVMRKCSLLTDGGLRELAFDACASHASVYNMYMASMEIMESWMCWQKK